MNGNNNHPVDDKQHVRSLVDNLVEKVATETENSYITVKTKDFSLQILEFLRKSRDKFPISNLLFLRAKLESGWLRAKSWRLKRKKFVTKFTREGWNLYKVSWVRRKKLKRHKCNLILRNQRTMIYDFTHSFYQLIFTAKSWNKGLSIGLLGFIAAPYSDFVCSIGAPSVTFAIYHVILSHNVIRSTTTKMSLLSRGAHTKQLHVHFAWLTTFWTNHR